ncbi:hypothetical protein B0I33_113208 [Prauserella shujinwangii]|uniref:Uncharacterized protein n=1 Tax=Prauserella shujinwangii TaxID=1453103 RepID=A0A2T0LLY0_9PSEU|nr:hypothetical protein [Prauserella shujinwangii]PRX44042.1 hypothetical protein B0I33_113208 [Prauserella shujinwangii]
MSTRAAPAADRRPATLIAALGVAALASALLAAGSLLPVVEGGRPGFASGPLLVTLAVLPLLAAGVLMLRGRHGASAGVLAGFAALAPGSAVLDLQFATDPSAAVRPELYLPSDLVEHAPAAGLWLLVGGHLAAVAAGVLAVRARDRRADADRPEEEPGAAERWRRRWLLVAVLAAVAAAFGLLMAPVVSTDVYLLARNAFEGPAVALTGYLLVAAALPLAAALAMTSGAGDFARGCLAGLAVAVLLLALPSLVAGVTVPVAELSAGPVVAVLGAAGLLAVAGTPRLAGPAPEQADDEAGGAAVPGKRRLRAATGALAVLTAGVAVAGSVTAQLDSATSGPAPESPARDLLLWAGVLVGILGAAMFVRRLAVVVRPVLSVAWVGVLLAGTAVLDTALTAASVQGPLSAGPGVLWTWLALCAAVVTACCSAVTGVVEREDEGDINGAQRGAAGSGAVEGNLLLPLGAAAVLSVAALGLPVVAAPDYVAAGLWSDFRAPSWGLLATALTVVGALALAPRSRPVPAAGMLVGAAAVLGLHAAALPLSGAYIDGATAGAGFWLALAAVAALLVSAGVAVAGRLRGTRS